MSSFGSAISSVLFGHNGSVKAWCLTGRSWSATATQEAFDAVNFIDGYNIRLDIETQLTGGIGIAATNNALVESGALKFSFITPMRDNKYKVFLQMYRDGTVSTSGFAHTSFSHVLNSEKFPKTNQSFWVRTGVFRTGGGGAGEVGRVVGLRTGLSGTVSNSGDFPLGNIGVVVI